jgi:hypothetical protein
MRARFIVIPPSVSSDCRIGELLETESRELARAARVAGRARMVPGRHGFARRDQVFPRLLPERALGTSALDVGFRLRKQRSRFLGRGRREGFGPGPAGRLHARWLGPLGRFGPERATRQGECGETYPKM